MSEPTSDNGGDLLISGATGMIGGLVVDALVEQQVPLIAMVRPGSTGGRLAGLPGVQLVEADFDDPGSLERALRGVARAFLVTNSSQRTKGQQQAFVAAARVAGVRHLVKLSQLHARTDSPVRFLRYHAAVEHARRLLLSCLLRRSLTSASGPRPRPAVSCVTVWAGPSNSTRSLKA